MNRVAWWILLVSCVTSPVDPYAVPDAPPPTWGDAESHWASSFCAMRLRCFPAEYEYMYGTDCECRSTVYNLNCDSIQCGELYPSSSIDSLLSCDADMKRFRCNSFFYPASCASAFFGPPRY